MAMHLSYYILIKNIFLARQTYHLDDKYQNQSLPSNIIHFCITYYVTGKYHYGKNMIAREKQKQIPNIRSRSILLNPV